MIDFHTWLEHKKKKEKKDSLVFDRDIEGETVEVSKSKRSPKIGKKNRLSLDAGGEPIETS